MSRDAPIKERWVWDKREINIYLVSYVQYAVYDTWYIFFFCSSEQLFPFYKLENADSEVLYNF